MSNCPVAAQASRVCATAWQACLLMTLALSVAAWHERGYSIEVARR